ncbi:hypothetical protein GFL49_14550 [Rhizobium leguminosarum bv. viciae]|nr:hypothetical protein [Rhizobium leguminosarum bv. viciae]
MDNGKNVALNEIPTLISEGKVSQPIFAVAPTLEEWKKMKTLGYGISGLIAFAGLTIGGIIAYASDGAVAALRRWLKIN